MSDDELRIRPATEADAPFLAEVLREAERSGAATTAYEPLFELSAAEAEELFRRLQEEDLEGSEFGWPNYLLAETAEGRSLAACAGWIEEAEGAASSLIKGQALAYMLGSERYRAAADGLKTFGQVAIERTPGSLQLEAFFTRPEARGQGLAQRLIEAHLARVRDAGHMPQRTQIQLLSNNAGARRAYERAGFALVAEAWTDDPALDAYLPVRGRILMERWLAD